MKYEREQLEFELIEWKRVANTRLCYHTVFSGLQKIWDKTWKTTTMKETVQLLFKAAASQEAHLLDENQQRITDFFDPIDFGSIDNDEWMKYLYVNVWKWMY